MKITTCLCLGCLWTSFVMAESPVDSSQPLKEISTEFELCDGPAWDGSGSLYIPDVKGEALYRLNTRQGKLTSVLNDLGRFSASFFNHGQLFLSDNGRARIVVLRGNELQEVAVLDASERPVRRPNDLVVDQSGGIYVTLTRQNQVAYVSADGEQSIAVEEIETPNGIILSPDGKTLYVSAYAPKEIWEFQVTSPGKTTGRRKLAVMDDGPEKGADGMTVDRAGNIYCAGASAVWIWSPAGELLDRIDTPTRPINCAFGDADMRSLYITCFGGLSMQRMRISGVAPNPPSKLDQGQSSSTRPSTAVPADIEAQLNVVYANDSGRKLLMDLFAPATRDEKTPAIVVVHGGGWLNGDKTKFRALAIALARRGYLTAAIEYRLGGEAKFPAAIHDCNAAVRYLRTHATELKIDPDNIGAVGGSAGGHLVGLMATGWQQAALQGDGGWPDASSRLQAAIVMAGPMEMTTGSVADRSRNQPEKSNSNRWIGKTIDEAPELYALADAHQHISADSPPILFMVGEHDHPQRNAASRAKLKSCGVWTDVKIYADGKHGCWNQLPWFDTMVADMDEFFLQHLSPR